MNNTISSKTAAAMLNVNESTIKRWADTNILKCVRTPGGHRKFTIDEIRNYAKQYNTGHPTLTNKLYTLPSQSELHQPNLQSFVKDMEKNLLKGNSKEVYDILFMLFIKKVHPAKIFDQVVKKTFENISNKYSSKKLGIEDEHIASNTILSALSQFENSIVQRKRNSRKVICCSLENELHGIGLMCLKIVFLYSGYDCIFPGINLPLKNLLDLIKEIKPQIVCISNSIPNENPAMQSQFKKLETASKKNNYELFIGGSNSNTNGLSDNVFCESIEEMLRRINSGK